MDRSDGRRGRRRRKQILGDVKETRGYWILKKKKEKKKEKKEHTLLQTRFGKYY